MVVDADVIVAAVIVGVVVEVPSSPQAATTKPRQWCSAQQRTRQPTVQHDPKDRGPVIITNI